MTRLITLVLAICLAASPAFADSWVPAERTTYLSSDKATRLTIVPRDLESPLAYFTDKVEGDEPAGQRTGGEPHALGIVEHRTSTGWSRIWQAPLVNDVAPVRALVTNRGHYVVTFDNWHSAGLGKNVVVIYRGDGSLVRSMKLSDILPDDYLRALPRSVSSLWWGGDHVLSPDERHVVLKVVIPGRSGSIGEPRGYLDVPIDLVTGTVARPSGPAWTHALAAVAPLAARSKAEEAGRRADMIAPLRSPPTEKDGWERYLYQATTRLAAPRKGDPDFGLTWILPSPADPDFAERAKDIRSVFAEWDEADDLAFASPSDPAALARTLIEGAQAGAPGRLNGSRLFVALPASLADGVRSALQRSGATVIIFDPAVPIPQRPETLREMGVGPDQATAEASRATVEQRRYEAEAVRLDALTPPEPRRSDKKSADGQADALAEAADRLEAVADEADEQADQKPK